MSINTGRMKMECATLAVSQNKRAKELQTVKKRLLLLDPTAEKTNDTLVSIGILAGEYSLGTTKVSSEAISPAVLYYRDLGDEALI